MNDDFTSSLLLYDSISSIWLLWVFISIIKMASLALCEQLRMAKENMRLTLTVPLNTKCFY